MTMKKTEKIIIISTAICLLVVIAFGLSYAFFEYTATGEENSFKASCYQVNYANEQNFTLTNTYPMSDSTGQSQTPYKLTMTNNCSKSIGYSIRLETIEGNTLPASDIRIKVGSDAAKDLTSNSSNTATLADNADNVYELKKGTLSNGSTESVEIRAWIKNQVTGDQNKTFQGKVTVQLSN